MRTRFGVRRLALLLFSPRYPEYNLFNRSGGNTDGQPIAELICVRK